MNYETLAPIYLLSAKAYTLHITFEEQVFSSRRKFNSFEKETVKNHNEPRLS